MRNRTWHKQPIGSLIEANSFGLLGESYFEHLAVNQYSKNTITCKRNLLRGFVQWCLIRDIERPEQVTATIIEAYQRHLHHHKQDNGKPLTASTQRTRLTAIKMFFKWLSKKGFLVLSPARHLKLPSVNQTLPKHVFSTADVEQVMSVPDVCTATGLRDRAMLEVLYSSAIRRLELVNLGLYDVDIEAGILRVRKGKGNKDRIVPIGERATNWITRYIEESRWKLQKHCDCSHLFLSVLGKPLSVCTVSTLCREYIKKAAINKEGSCHVFRHTTATLMLENGADIRVIQSMLGHASLSTTQIYTKVSIKHLKEVHSNTHPAKL
jgi:integrase/recombinase XerD